MQRNEIQQFKNLLFIGNLPSSASAHIKYFIVIIPTGFLNPSGCIREWTDIKCTHTR